MILDPFQLTEAALTIARAFKDALFYLDEGITGWYPNRRIDSKAMTSFAEGRTSFVIAYRLSTIRNADLILVMKDGNIYWNRQQDELMAQMVSFALIF